MARSLGTDPIYKLEENLECTVCLERLNDPITLPCCHSFCKVCLEGVVKTCRGKAHRDRPIREIPCPNCRTTFALDPDKQVADMPRNHFICNMVQAMAVLDRGIGVPCSHSCSQSYSVARCVTCEKFLCRECVTAHNNYRANNGHSVLTMEELSRPENRKKIKDQMYCDEHSGMILKVYCETCDQLICRDCMDFKHVKQSHSCVLVKDVANNYKELLDSSNKAMDDALTEGNTFLQQLTLETEQLHRDAENIRSQITQKKEFVAKKVHQMLDKKANILLKKVKEIEAAKEGRLEQQTEETKKYVQNIKTSVQLSKKLVDQGTDEEIISSQKMMLDNAGTLLTQREEYLKASIPVANFNYTGLTNRDVKEILQNKEILGVLENALGEVGGDITAQRPIDCNLLRGYAEVAAKSETSTVTGSMAGKQPPGKMIESYRSTSLPGFETCGTIVISYIFASGIQGPDHPNPGKPYTGLTRTAYLPDNKEGGKVLKLLKKAFLKKLTFTIGQSATTVKDDFVTFNIHHKTSMRGGPTYSGYPDPDYLKVVKNELAAKGIKE